MKIRLKPLEEQVIVITGASSGIGLATAREAARRGARVVLTARNKSALKDVTKRIVAEGGRATWVAADVADAEAVERVAETAIETFGHIDTWVNNASSAIYGKLWEMDLADKHRLFEVNFWGMVNGCRAALPELVRHGGALINIGSVVSSQAIPLLGMYSATKHAVKAYTDTLRMELEHDEAPVSVTLVKPASINTPFFDHAKSEMDATPKPAPPVYAPEVVADVILHCAEHPTREIQVGGAGKMMSAMGTLAQGLTERVFARTLAGDAQQDDRPRMGSDNLYEPSDFDGVVHGNYDGHVMRSSLYTRAKLHAAAAALTALGVGAVAALGAAALRRRRAPSADVLADASALPGDRFEPGDEGNAPVARGTREVGVRGRRGRGRALSADAEAPRLAGAGGAVRADRAAVPDSAESALHTPGGRAGGRAAGGAA